jgi:hypothetical protein
VDREALELQEQLPANPSDPLVSIDERLILRQRLHERRSFQRERRVSVLAEYCLLRASDGGCEPAGVAKNRRSDRFPINGLDIILAEVLHLRVGERLQ